MTLPFDVHAFRQHFPLFQQFENQSLVYLDNAASHQRPQCLIDAIVHFYSHQNANAHRSSHRLARAATQAIETSRQKAAEFLGAEHKDTIIFTRGATEALNLLAASLCQELQAGDEILLSEIEHHANLVPWQMAAEKYQLKLKFIPYSTSQQQLQLELLPELISDKTKIVSISGASNTLGCITQLDTIKSALPSDSIFIVDAAQLCAHQTVDVQQLNCDFLVCSAHKFYGPTGVGLLYGKPQRLESLAPWQGGGEMVSEVKLQSSLYAAPPHKFEPGTSALADIAALASSLDFIQQQNLTAMQQHEQKLCHQLHQGLQGLAHIQLHSKTQNNIGVVSFSCGGKEDELAHLLDQSDIAIRSGQHCTHPLLARLGCSNLLRASIAAYNTSDDIQTLIGEVKHWSDEQQFDGHLDTKNINVGQTNDQSIQPLQFNNEDLLKLSSWKERHKLILRWGQKLPQQDHIRCDANLVSGCETKLWLHASREAGGIIFYWDSDSRLIRGLAAVCINPIQGKNSQAVAATDFQETLSNLGLEQHLSPSRNNGIHALIKAILKIAQTGC